MKKALAIAIAGGYPDPYKRKAPLNDLADLVATLTPKGFQITSLTDANATRGSILTALAGMIGSAQAGDSLVFAFFGHGSYVAGPEPDGRTECICPVDVFSAGPITDGVLNAYLSQLPLGCNCDVILDCCYAGTGTRSASPESKKEDKTGKNHKWKDLQPFYIPGPLKVPTGVRTSVPVSGMNHVLWAACKDNQLAWEGLSGGKYRSIYTTYLCYAWRNFPTYTRSQVDAWVYPRVKNVVASQECQLEGDPVELAQVVFS